MDEILYNSLKEAYLRASGIGETEIAKSIGFKDLQGFLDKQPERPSVLMNLK